RGRHADTAGGHRRHAVQSGSQPGASVASPGQAGAAAVRSARTTTRTRPADRHLGQLGCGQQPSHAGLPATLAEQSAGAATPGSQRPAATGAHGLVRAPGSLGTLRLPRPACGLIIRSEPMPVPDLFTAGLARGWKTHDGSRLEDDLSLEADVAIVGSGAGGATSAEILSAAGFKVLLIEEGPLRTSSDFDLQEPTAYQSLYQEGIGRMSKDGAITILQGRAVGGTTLVNWTSSFRTPPQTLEHWAREHAVSG